MRFPRERLGEGGRGESWLDRGVGVESGGRQRAQRATRTGREVWESIEVTDFHAQKYQSSKKLIAGERPNSREKKTFPLSLF